MLTIPGQLKIGNLTYTVEWLHDDLATEYDGRSSHRRAYIKLDRSMSVTHKRETLLHEIIHQLLSHGGYHDEGRNDHLVNCLANGLLQVLTDNGLWQPPQEGEETA